jgi:hypothetical protein
MAAAMMEGTVKPGKSLTLTKAIDRYIETRENILSPSTIRGSYYPAEPFSAPDQHHQHPMEIGGQPIGKALFGQDTEKRLSH